MFLSTILHTDLAEKIGGSTCEDEVTVLRRRLIQTSDLIEEQVSSREISVVRQEMC